MPKRQKAILINPRIDNYVLAEDLRGHLYDIKYHTDSYTEWSVAVLATHAIETANACPDWRLADIVYEYKKYPRLMRKIELLISSHIAQQKAYMKARGY